MFHSCWDDNQNRNIITCTCFKIIFIFFFFGSVVKIKLVRDFFILIFTVSLLFLFYTNNNPVYLLFRLWLVVLLHELHVHDYVQKEKNKRPMISLCRSAFWLLLLSLFLFYFFFFYEINITMMLNVKLIHFKIKYLSMTISKSHISK